MTSREIAAIVTLVRHPDVLTRDVADLVQDHRSALLALEHVLSSSTEPPQLFSTTPGDEDTGRVVDLDRVEAEVDGWLDEDITITTVLDPEYPENLHTVHDRPPLLFVHGALRATDERSVAIVGTRQATEVALRCTADMARRMVESGYVVVSGLADGIDTAAHRATLAAGGRTVAVIGTGLRHSFPKSNTGLQRELGARHAVVSQFWPDQGARRWTFPARNAVMSGLSRATIVIEASNTSGARTQARLALEHGRPVFLLRSLLQHKWAQEHSRRPGSYVIDTPDEVLEILEREYAPAVALTA